MIFTGYRFGRFRHFSNVRFIFCFWYCWPYDSRLVSCVESTLDSLTACLEVVKAWLANNFLFLNSDKTEVIVFDPSETRPRHDLDLGSLDLFISLQVRNSGVMLHSSLKFNKQISAVIGSNFFYFRLLAKIKSYLPKRSLEIAIHALITSRLNYCNPLYFDVSKSQTAHLQIVQNAARDSWRERVHLTMPPPFWDHYLCVVYIYSIDIYNSLHSYIKIVKCMNTLINFIRVLIVFFIFY